MAINRHCSLPVVCIRLTRLDKLTVPASVLFTTFGLAILCTISAIAAFTTEMMMAGSGVRAEVPRQRSAEQL